MSYHYRWFSRDKELTGDYGERKSRAELDKKPKNPAHLFSHGERLGMLLAVLMIAYSIAFSAGASFTLAGVAFLVYELRRLMPILLGPSGVPVAKAMRTFGIVALFGAVALLFV